MLSLLAIAFTFGLVIFLHELGHFFVAKKKKIKVENFSFGFGPEIYGREFAGTRYSLRLVPLGGMVKMKGELLEEKKGEADEFLSQPWYSRIAVVAAGPLMNYFLAIFIFAAVVYFWGIPKVSTEPVIGEIVAGMPADEAGLKPGDRILKIGEKKITLWEEAAKIIHQSPGKKLELEISRKGEPFHLSVTPKFEEKQKIGLIGITPEVKTIKLGLLNSLLKGVEQVIFWTVFTFAYLGRSLVKLTAPELAGPVGIAQVVAQTAKTGWQNFLYLLGLISTGVAIFNFLPIPMLDGGHILFSLWEGVTKKPLTKQKMKMANALGLAIILTIFLLATYNDLVRLLVGGLKR